MKKRGWTITLVVVAIVAAVGVSAFQEADARRQYREENPDETLKGLCFIGEIASFLFAPAGLACLPAKLSEFDDGGRERPKKYRASNVERPSKKVAAFAEMEPEQKVRVLQAEVRRLQRRNADLAQRVAALEKRSATKIVISDPPDRSAEQKKK